MALSNPRFKANRLAPRFSPKLALLLSAGILAAIYLGSPNFNDRSEASGPYGGDFLQEWIGGYIVLQGDTSRFYETAYAAHLQHDPLITGYRWDDGQYLPIVYPPFYYTILAPLALLPMKSATVVWACLMVTALALTVCILAKIAGPTAARLAWMLPAALLFAPMIENLTSSQKATVILLILSSTYWLLIRGKPVRAGLVFGLLAFKPQLTLVIALAMLCKRQWSFVGGGALTGAILIGICFSLGADVCSQYFRLATGMSDYIQTAGYDLYKAHCWHGFFALLLGRSPTVLINSITALAVLMTVVLVARILRGPLQTDSPRFPLQFSALVVATVLLSPHLLSYDLSMLLLPMFLLAVELARKENPLLDVRRRHVIWGLVAVYLAGSVSVSLARMTGIQISVLVIASLLITLVRRTVCVTDQPQNSSRSVGLS